ncbi:MAG: hypothetical protein BM556_07260 [Bacteriovorax sp. MedPE-SWde]|nr:MAG: hypothetical protein BM556_07260 [Bacteriovorax sp. MedPE-SWde]
MNIEKVLFVIYSIENKSGMNRFIDLAYSLKGLVQFDELQLLKDEYAQFYKNDRIGPFDTEEELIRFSYLLSEKSRMEAVCLCGSEAINTALTKVSKVSDLNEALFEVGEILENPEEKKRGLFSGLLN